jgi:hypothetical protein
MQKAIDTAQKVSLDYFHLVPRFVLELLSFMVKVLEVQIWALRIVSFHGKGLLQAI